MDDLDAAIELVYAEPPSGFVTARAALFKELKAVKRKDDAATVAGLRRPTRLAWALGEAVRQSAEAATAFFTAVDALAEPGGEIRGRTADLRSAVSRLVLAAEAVDAGEATAAFLATAADPTAVTALRLGRLAEVPAGGGFGSPWPDDDSGATPEAADAEMGLDGSADGPPSAGGEAAGRDAPTPADQERADASASERTRREQEARARAERLTALEEARTQAAEAEAAAAEGVDSAHAAVEEAQTHLAAAEAAFDAAQEVAREAAELLSAAQEQPPADAGY